MNFKSKIDLTYQTWADNQSVLDLQIFDTLVKAHITQLYELHNKSDDSSVLSCLSSAVYLSNLNSFFENIPQYLFDFYQKNNQKLSPVLYKCFEHHVQIQLPKVNDNNVVNMFDFKLKKINQIEEDKILSEFNL